MVVIAFQMNAWVTEMTCEIRFLSITDFSLLLLEALEIFIVIKSQIIFNYEFFEYLNLNYFTLCPWRVVDLKISEKPYKIEQSNEV